MEFRYVPSRSMIPYNSPCHSRLTCRVLASVITKHDVSRSNKDAHAYARSGISSVCIVMSFIGNREYEDMPLSLEEIMRLSRIIVLIENRFLLLFWLHIVTHLATRRPNRKHRIAVTRGCLVRQHSPLRQIRSCVYQEKHGYQLTRTTVAHTTNRKT